MLNWVKKDIDNLHYYTQKNVELGIPTWYGIEINGGYNYLSGDKLNTSDTKVVFTIME